LEVRETVDWTRLLLIDLPWHTCPRIALDDHGRLIAVGDWQGRVRCWETATGGETVAVAERSSPVTAVALATGCSRISVGDQEGTVRVLDLRTGRVVFRWEGLLGFAKRTIPELAEHLRLPAEPAEFAGLTGILGVLHWHLQQDAAQDSVVSQWKCLTNRGHMSMVVEMVFSPDGSQLASIDSDGTLAVWDMATGTRRFDCNGHRGARNHRSLAFSPDGQRLVAAGADHTVKVWEVRSGAALCALSGHAGPVKAVAASPDGQRFATGGTDGAVKLWEAAAGKEAFSFEGHAAAVQSVAFSGDGKQLLSAGVDGTVMVWEAGLPRA
jgi:WD40 repeat protein